MSWSLRERWKHPLRRRVGIDEKAIQRVTQEMQREFFFDVLGHPKRTDLLLYLRSPGPRQNDYRLLGIETADLPQDREPIHPRHVQIKNNDIGVFSAKELQALPTTLSEYNDIALPTE